jgi:hypothetical protein
VTATITGNPVEVGLAIDGMVVATTTTPPYSFLTLGDLTGDHAIEIGALDAANNEVDAETHVTVGSGGGGGGDGSDGSGSRGGGGGNEETGGGSGCSAPGNASSLLLLIGLLGLARRPGACRRDGGAALCTRCPAFVDCYEDGGRAPRRSRRRR